MLVGLRVLGFGRIFRKVFSILGVRLIKGDYPDMFEP